MQFYNSKIFSVSLELVKLPNGKRRMISKIIHRGGVVIVPVIDHDTILLIRQYRFVIGKWLYELPAGRIEPNENAMKQARRELLEEAGYSARSMKFAFKSWTTPGMSTELLNYFVATGLEKRKQHLEPDEFIRVEKVKLADAINMIKTGKIIDAKTIQGIFFYSKFYA